ncbi:hypothetical protein ACM0K4_00245 [Mycoplasma sp. VS42A]|uniref:hypothetical protein n=1 Tax=Mycoplasma sp. VS42A TaxID=3398774 RepID=UPI003A8B882F
MDYLNEQTALYVYKIESDKPITFQKNSVNVIALGAPEEFEVMVLNNAKIPAINTDSESFSNKLFNSKTIVASNELTEHLNTSAFYLFSFEQVQDASNFKDFYIAENKIDNFELADSFNNLNELTLTQLSYYKELQNMDFVVVNNLETYKQVIKNTNSIELELNSSALINHINVVGANNAYLDATVSNVNPFLLFVNPFRIEADKYSLNFWSLENYNFGLYNDATKTNEFLKDNEFLNHLKKIVSISKIVQSNFKGMDSKQITDFQNQNGNITDLKSYTNAYLKEILDNYLYSGEFDKYLKFKSYILASSNYLISDYCWKGGNNYEFQFYSPAAFNYNASNVTTVSRLYSLTKDKIFSKVKNEFLHSNVFSHFGHNIQLPLLNEQLEEIDYSQNPVDFNDKSYNLNYPVYYFANSQDFEKIVDYSKNIPTQKEKTTRSIIFPMWIQIKGTDTVSFKRTFFYKGNYITVDELQNLTSDEQKYLLQAGQELGSEAKSFYDMFGQINSPKIEIDFEGQFYWRARRLFDTALEYAKINNNSAHLKNVNIITKVGNKGWDPSSFKTWMKEAGMEDVSNPLADPEKLYKQQKIASSGMIGLSYALFFIEYIVETPDNTNFADFFNSLNKFHFDNKETFEKSVFGSTYQPEPIKINILINSQQQIQELDIAGFWIEYLKIPNLIENKIQLNNKTYTKIIFW